MTPARVQSSLRIQSGKRVGWETSKIEAVFVLQSCWHSTRDGSTKSFISLRILIYWTKSSFTKHLPQGPITTPAANSIRTCVSINTTFHECTLQLLDARYPNMPQYIPHYTIVVSIFFSIIPHITPILPQYNKDIQKRRVVLRMACHRQSVAPCGGIPCSL